MRSETEHLKLIIFGTQGYALSVYEAIKALKPDRQVECFLVSESGGINPDSLLGLPVYTVIDFANRLAENEKLGYEVLIATPEDVQQEIKEILNKYGFLLQKSITSESFNSLMNLYHEKLGKFKPLSILSPGHNTPPLEIYAAKHEGDRTVKEGLKAKDYIFPIQVGTVFSKNNIADLHDSDGDNISNKNRNYSELTALYWVWKNRLENETYNDNGAVLNPHYFGLFQYRRIFDLSEDDIKRLSFNDVDALLPFPLVYEPDINSHHKRYLKPSDWDCLIKALEEIHPEYSGHFSKILSQRYLYNYNIILAKDKVLRDYCRWLFPVLERVEELSSPKGFERGDRYIGYMAESLETLYFMMNSDRLNIFHIGCKMLV